ncbi:MAG: CD1247 N-terminal domain-containing protein [Bacillota bacterium]
MGDLSSRVAYLKGLAEGLNLEAESKEGRLLNAILGVLGEFAEEVESLRGRVDEQEEYLEDLDEDVAELEERVAETEEGEEEFFEVQCPHCGETVSYAEEELGEEGPMQLRCPNCGELIYRDEEDEEEEGPPERR